MNNPEALGHLVTLKDKIHLWLHKFGFSKAEAEDVFQEAIVKAIKTDTLTEEIINIDGWFYKILTNTAVDVLRKRKLISSKEKEVIEVQLSNSEIKPQICGCVSSLLNKLAPEDQSVLHEHFYGGRSLKSISQEKGISESALRVRALRARKKLKDLFKECCNPKGMEDLKNCGCE